MSAPKLKTIKPAKKAAEILMQDASLDIWDKKYRLKDKESNPVDADINATYMRVAKALSDVEEESKREVWQERFVWALQHGAIPAGRIISNAGAQAYKPAISTISIVVGTTFSGFTRISSLFNLLSGTVIVPTLGSIVQKGKFADCAFAFERQLKSVDFPTFGKPTIPHLRAIYKNLFSC